jgi:acyl transferase domain-containing protein
MLHGAGLLYTAGTDLDWEAMDRSYGCRRVEAPTYPFQRQRHWLDWGAQGSADADPATSRDAVLPGAVTDGQAASAGSVLARAWRAAPIGPAAADLAARRIAVLVRPRAPWALKSALAGVLCDSRLLVEFGPPVFDPGDREAGARLADRLGAMVGGLEGVIDLCDLGQAADDTQVEYGRIGFYQAMIAARGESPVLLLHVSAGLLSGRRLAGAPLAGLVAAIGAEYQGVTARSIDVSDAAVDPGRLLEILGHESAAAAAPEREVRYGPSGREVPELRQVTPRPRLTIRPDHCYVISGGTRGLGAEFARMLADRGARRLAVLGAQPLPPRSRWREVADGDTPVGRKIGQLLALEDRGVDLLVHTGPLLDSVALGRFFEEVRSRLGQIGGVLHCAGVVSDESPAFLHKTTAGMARVLEPKVAGTWTLADVLDGDRPDFFVLFSSVAAAVPSLAVGLSDYAMANAFLDRFAEFQHGRGRTWFRSVNWPSFRSVGLGEVRTAAYRATGLPVLDAAGGLDLLDNLLGVPGEPVLLPAAAIRQAGERDVAYQSLVRIFSTTLMLAPERLRGDVPFGEYGVDSVLLAAVVRQIEGVVGEPFEPAFLFEHPTLDSLAGLLTERYPDRFTAPAAEGGPEATATKPSERLSAVSEPTRADTSIAVIGMGCRFPGASGKERFWDLLSGGECAVREVPPERWDTRLFYSPTQAPGVTVSKWGGFLDDIDLFDPGYFGIGEAEAAQVDPLQRLMLETALTATLDAGYSRGELSGRRAGVFVGTRVGRYLNRIEHPDKSTIIGNGQNFIAARISDFFNWHGASLVLDSACSSSLVTIHLACQALRTGEVDLALAGGVDLLLDETPYLMLSAAGALSPDGHCRTFDETASGFVPGEGAGAVLLKRLDQAVADGDQIHAVIRGSAIGNDGHTMGITTPSLDAQVEVIEAALAASGVSAAEISYVEAHGTGTMLGDPIELKALERVFRKATDARGYCAVGSVKTNIGHLLSAAGIAAFIKTVLALEHATLPASLHCDRPNPRFAFTESPLRVQRETQPWPAQPDRPRRAGVSAFGFGGTNGHLILEEAVAVPARRSPLPSPALARQRYLLDRRPRPEPELKPVPPPSARTEFPLFQLEPMS